MEPWFNGDHPNFSLLYNGKSFFSLPVTMTETHINADQLVRCYQLPDGLSVTQTMTYYRQFNAVEWVLYFENHSDQPSGVLSDIWDCDCTFGFNQTYTPPVPGWVDRQTVARVFRTIGSNLVKDEYAAYAEPFPPATERRYRCEGGRSSQGLAPYFDVNEGDKGVICAIGWTGQWNAAFQAVDQQIRVRTGIESLSFRLLPHEKLRTSSVLLLRYENGQNQGHNQFRRLMKQHFSLIGSKGRPENGPLAVGAWGALPSAVMIERIAQLKKHHIGAEYYWIDAGWYGYSSGGCPNEFTGDWAKHTGSWVVNKNYHPDGLLEVRKAMEDADMGFIFWLEPERVLRGTDTPIAHPEWFLELNPENDTLLIDYGNEAALEGTFSMLSEMIEKLDVSCYRQDFNMEPLNYWRKNDEPERQGIHEIKHIMGLYRLWDRLLERFPHLFIDNCASGGRRNDFEMMRRSIPLWRSDCQCWWDADPEIAQTHNTGISWWLPYSGTGVGTIMGDTYRTRSCYSAAMTTSFWGYEHLAVSDDQPLDNVRKLFQEYKRVRPYFSCDFYPLTENTPSSSVWCGWQYNRPEQTDGIVLAFRRPDSLYTDAQFTLGGLAAGASYEFIDADTGEAQVLSSNASGGLLLNITIKETGSSKLYFYRKVPSVN